MPVLEGGIYDQVNPEGHHDPYWDAVRRNPLEFIDGEPFLCTTGNPDLCAAEQHSGEGIYRRPLCQKYSWSVLSPFDRAWISDQTGGRPLVEIGAGSGYWAWQLAQGGTDVVAYDPHPVSPGNRYCTSGPYFPVRQGDESAVAHHPDRVLMMVWPPKGSPYAANALARYTGDLLIYAGLPAGRCTADDTFHDVLGRDWEMFSVSTGHISWCNARDNLTAFRRRFRSGN